MPYQDMMNPLENFPQEFAHFRAEQDCRLQEIESKQAGLLKIGNQLTELEHQMTTVKGRISQLEGAASRPVLLSTKSSFGIDSNNCQEKFVSFIKSGCSQGLEAKSLSSLDEGGVSLVSNYVHEKIIEQLSRLSPIRALASVMGISSEGIDVLIEKQAPSIGWAAETAERKETQEPTLQKLHISTHEMYAKPKITQKLLDDAVIDLENWIVRKITQQMTALESQAFLKGDGQNKPKGILNYPLGDKSSWGVFEQVLVKKDPTLNNNALLDGIFATVHALKPEHLNNAVWMMNRQTLGYLRKLKDTTERFLWQPSFSMEMASTLLGYPVILFDEMPGLAPDKKGAAMIFGDFKSAYQIVDRTGVHVLRDPYSAKPYVEFYVTRRVGGDVVNFDALKMLSFEG